MDSIRYHMSVHHHGGVRLWECDAKIPSGMNTPDCPVDAQQEIVSALLSKGIEDLEAKHGAFHCGICGKEANLYMNHFIFTKSRILDTVSAICGYNRCEVRAAQFKTVTRRGLMTTSTGPAGSGAAEVHIVTQCGACGKTDNTRACSGCKLTAYCGKECQLRDWPEHKPICRARRQAA